MTDSKNSRAETAVATTDRQKAKVGGKKDRHSCCCCTLYNARPGRFTLERPPTVLLLCACVSMCKLKIPSWNITPNGIWLRLRMMVTFSFFLFLFSIVSALLVVRSKERNRNEWMNEMNGQVNLQPSEILFCSLSLSFSFCIYVVEVKKDEKMKNNGRQKCTEVTAHLLVWHQLEKWAKRKLLKKTKLRTFFYKLKILTAQFCLCLYNQKGEKE